MDKLEQTDLDDDIIDITPRPKRSSVWLKWYIAPAVVLFIVLTNSVGIYTDVLWFGSLGFSGRFWYVFSLGWILFAVFAVLTIAIVRGGFYILERIFGPELKKPRLIVINKEQLVLNFGRFVGPLSWIVALVFGLVYGFSLSADWQSWALYLNQPTVAATDPIFDRSLGFYLFSFPIYSELASWLSGIALLMLAAAVVFSVLSMVPSRQAIVDEKGSGIGPVGPYAYSAVSLALGALILTFVLRTILSRYEFLWADHSSFSGVTYSEANYLIPGLTIVAVSLAVAAAILFVNAFTKKGGRLILVAIALPVLVYLVAAVAVPAYVQSFIVKPNELGRETPYIEHNIAGTRTGFNIEHVTEREYAADITPESLNLAANTHTLSNIRLWDWQALQDTLRQIQEIRTYYDFPDVDVDRYRVDGVMRQVMIATRELDVNKLPEQSRNWINERLVYTHGYGVTMNPVNEFTEEGKPRFLISNMPLVSTADVHVTRPEIYFGERTETNVYVRTKQPEFDYPQGEGNNYTAYEGEGGFAVGSGFRRFCIAWEMNDLSKLPFSDDVTSDSRVLMHRGIVDRIGRIAPFLTLDDDPYMVVNSDGRLVWIVDAYTSTNRYPYSRHFSVGKQSVNYIRNSVKVTVDAYTGAVNLYVFDATDPIVSAYRTAFPDMFKPAAEMPEGLRLHIRYPETLIKTQGDVFGLYHTTNAKMFFGREDVWGVARDAQPADTASKSGTSTQPVPLEPYQVLMPLPGERAEPEYARVLPFTPGNRNNMIAWLAGRSDGDAYGQLLVYNFPSSRVIDGPLQIEARIDQDAQLAGQITLWNQQGSKVKRGNLIIMPIGTGLLFVEPIYLQAVRSPMPELRLVVLATQERLVYAGSFDAALALLLGQPQKNAPAQPNDKTTPAAPAAPTSSNELIKRAGQTFADYQRLTAEGKLGEAGQKLDELKRILDQLQTGQK